MYDQNNGDDNSGGSSGSRSEDSSYSSENSKSSQGSNEGKVQYRDLEKSLRMLGDRLKQAQSYNITLSYTQEILDCILSFE